MIIASPAKKELAIQLQVLQQPLSARHTERDVNRSIAIDDEKAVNTVSIPHEHCSASHVDKDIVTFVRRDKDDFVATVFGHTSQMHQQVEQLMSISTVAFHGSAQTVHCQAFIHGDTVFLSSPVTDDVLANWNDGEFQSCITHLIELAEEKTGSEYLVVAIDRQTSSNTILRAFMYLGFQLVDPSVYGQDSRFTLVGYEL